MNRYIEHSRPTISAEEVDACVRVLESSMIAQGQLAREFETRFAAHVHSAHAVATASGTWALFLALKALGVGCGDEVICPTYVCHAVTDAIFQAGAKPALVDIEDDFQISLDGARQALGERTRAVIIPHLFGRAVDCRPWRELGLPLVEDCAQNIGGTIDGSGQLVGSQGDLAIYSFHATKLMSTGEGGMVVTGDPVLHQRLRQLNDGYAPDSGCHCPLRLPDLNAALGLVQLQRIDAFLKRRMELARMYSQALERMPFLELPPPTGNIFYRYPLKLTSQQHRLDFVINHFLAHHIKVKRPVDTLLHHYLGIAGDFDYAEKLFETTFSIPLYPSLDDLEVERILAALHALAEAWGS